MTTGVFKWSTTAATNATADTSINWAEGQSPSSVNDSARAMMARLAEYRDDTAGTLTTGGTSTAYTLTSNQVFDSLADMSGQNITVKFNATNSASPTLNVDSLGAKAIHSVTGTAIPVGMIQANSIWNLTYDNSNSCFVLQGNTPLLITTQTAETSPATDDELPIYDTSATANRKMTLANVLKVITILAAETAPAVDDELAMYDTSGTTTDKITLANLLKVVDALTEDTSPDTSNDFVLSYDTSATSAKKIKLANVTGGMKLLATASLSTAASVAFIGGATPTGTGVTGAGTAVLDDTYDDYLIEFSFIPATDDVGLYMTVGTGATPTYQSANYSYSANLILSNGTNGGLGSTSDGQIVLTSVGGGVAIDSASAGCRGWVKISNPDATAISLVNFQATWAQDTTPAMRSTQGGGCWSQTTAITALKFAPSSGNFASGRFSLYGYSKTV